MQNDIKKALEVLQNGGVILYPTDTIWGLGCDATNKEAVDRIYKIKNRADNKSMIILMDHPGRMSSYLEDIPEVALDLMELAEKPLTVILEGAKNLAENVINQEDRSVGIRLPNDEFCQQLIQRFRKPIVSTSANISGNPTPAIFDEVDDEIKEMVDYIVKYRQEDINKAQPSGIVKIGKSSEVKVIRH